MAWRIAKSLDKLRSQINTASPNRSKASDGTIGDAAHASRSSDHNPWVKDGNTGVVTALDITHDPLHGVDAGKIADTLRLSGDPRIKYIISNGRIANSGAAWRKYTGSNKHTLHFHISVNADKKLYDDSSAWECLVQNADIKVPITTKIVEAIVGPLPAPQNLAFGNRGKEVEALQKKLKVTVDGIFGPKTEEAVKAAQKKAKLPADGVVGPYTRKALGL